MNESTDDFNHIFFKLVNKLPTNARPYNMQVIMYHKQAFPGDIRYELRNQIAQALQNA